MGRNADRVLVGYCVAVSAVVAGLLLMGTASRPPDHFDEITVHRINVVEPDGTLRMVISDKARLPGVIVKGVEHTPQDRPQAGVLFYNDEGSENGGLIFGGHKDAQGRVVDAGGSLSFDKYGASEVVRLIGVDDSTDHLAGLNVMDGRHRVWIGRGADGAAVVNLMDASGRKRVALEAPASGEPSLQFFDETGRATQKLVPAP